MKEKNTSTVDAEEIARFSRIASEWWNPNGKFKPLHRLNPARIAWILEQAAADGRRTQENAFSPPATRHSPPLQGLRLLDIGCGGGLIAEPMARLGAEVTAIDAAEKNIAVAKLHAEQSGLAIDYRCMTAEGLLDDAPASYDVVLALEIIEHVSDVAAFAEACCGLLKPGGLLIMSTLNRTAKSYALAIIGAEYILRWLPVGTHSWKKFLRPSELAAQLRRQGITIEAVAGLVMNPLDFTWRIDASDLSVNYLLAGRKPG